MLHTTACFYTPTTSFCTHTASMSSFAAQLAEARLARQDAYRKMTVAQPISTTTTAGPGPLTTLASSTRGEGEAENESHPGKDLPPDAPPGIDPDVFTSLPPEIKDELLLAAAPPQALKRPPANEIGAGSQSSPASWMQDLFIARLVERRFLTLKPRSSNGARKRLKPARRTSPPEKGSSAENAIALDSSSDDDEESSPPPASSTTFIVQSQNLWFDPTSQNLRVSHMRDAYFTTSLPSSSPYIVSICQELTAPMVRVLESTGAVAVHDQQMSQGSAASTVRGGGVQYGTCVVHPGWVEPEERGHLLYSSSRMGRGLTFAGETGGSLCS